MKGNTIKKGDKVKMSRACRLGMIESGSEAHVLEFGHCEGVVLGPLDYNNVPKGHKDYDENKVGPEVDVRWQPSGLKYGYDPDKDLVKIS